MSSNFTMEMRNGLQNRRRSSSLPQTLAYQLNNSSKRPSNETILSSQLNSRQQSKVVLNVEEP